MVLRTMRSAIYIFFSFALSLLMLSCKDGGTYAVLKDVESYIQTRPDSALATLRTIDESSLFTRKERALYALLHTMALDKNYIDPKNESLIMPAVDYYRKHGTPDEKLKAFFYLGRICMYNKDYNSAVNHYTEGYQIINKCRDYRYRTMLCDDLSKCFTINYYRDESVKYEEEAVSYFPRFNKSEAAYADALLGLSAVYGNAGEWIKADSILTIVENMEISDKSRSNMCLQRGRYYAKARPFRDYKLACSYFEEGMSLGGIKPENLSPTGFMFSYVSSLNNEGRSDEAADILSKYEAAHIYRDDKTQTSFYNNLSHIAATRKDYKTAYTYLRQSLYYQNRDLDAALKGSAYRSQMDYFVTKKKQNDELVSKQRVSIICIGLISLLIALLAFLLYRRQRARMLKESNTYAEIAELSRMKLLEAQAVIDEEKKHVEQLSEEASSLKDRLSGAEKSLSSLEGQVLDKEKTLSSLRSEYANMYREKFRYLGELCETYFRASGFNEPQRHVYEKVQRMIKDISGDRDGQQRFEKMIDKELGNIMKYFREDFPNYLEDDYRFVSYVFVGFDSTTLLVVLGMPSQSSVYVKKNRIKNAIKNSSSPRKDLYLSMFL